MTPHRKLLADYAESGSEEAFRQLVAAYIGLVHGSALRLVNGNCQLAEDVAQTVFTDLARQAKTLSPDIMIGGWLHRRTCHAAANATRSERRRVVRETEAFEMNTINSENPEAPLDWASPVLDEAINQLDADDRDAIMLRFFERSNLRAIGEALGTTESTAQKRVERALEKLRVVLVRRGVVLSTTALALAISSASAMAVPAGLAATISTAALAGAHAGAGLTTLKIMAMTKLKITVLTAAVALLAVGATTTVVLTGKTRAPAPEPAYAYTPPPNPDPQAILDAGRAEATAGSYPEALAKYIWYRDNAVKIQPAQSGVRNSYALMYWSELALKYPPAMEKLLSIRDDTAKQVHDPQADGFSVQAAFIIVLSINQGLKNEAGNVELFQWLDAHNRPAARGVFSLVEASLIDAGDYALCGLYLDADGAYQRILDQRNRMKSGPNAPHLKDFYDNTFSNQSARLVAVLAINQRAAEADKVAAEAAKELAVPEFAASLADAKKGQVPPRWPPPLK